MLSAAIGYQVLQQKNLQTIDKVKAALEKHPCYASQWQARFEDVPVADHRLVLFMQAARWAIRDKQHHQGTWHYMTWQFKPEGPPASVQAKDPESVNILKAMADNESMVRNGTDSDRRAIALAWFYETRENRSNLACQLHDNQIFWIKGVWQSG